MIVLKAFKFRLDPTAPQRELMAQTAGCVRLVWNKTLAEVKEALDKKEGYQGYTAAANKLPAWKREEATAFLRLVPAQPLQQALKDLDRAAKDAFKKVRGFPKFKKKFQKDNFRYPQGVKVDGNLVYLPKIGWVKFRASREIIGTIKNTTVKLYAGQWYVSFQTEFEVEDPIHPSTSAIGIDVGIAKFAAMSDGTVVPSINPLRRLESKLGRAQQTLSRRVKKSNNSRKQIIKIQKIHKKIRNTRKDFLHKASTALSKSHAVIVIEDLKVGNMSASAKGTIEDPGRNVRAKAGLNKSILDQGWSEFRRMLEYKQKWRGGKVIAIAPQYTSQRCSVCGHTSAENRPTQAVFRCTGCGHSQNADLNAAKNILAAGCAVIACGDISPVTD